MIQIRSSMTGRCSKEIVTSIIQPEERTDEVQKRDLFLKMGHTAQIAMVCHLEDCGVEIIEEEASSTKDMDIFSLTGHVDLRAYDLDHTSILVEIKAIKAANYRRVLKNGWEKTYPAYVAQAEAYLALWPKDICLAMIFIDRDNGEAVGGISLPNSKDYKFDSDFIFHRDITRQQKYFNRLERIAQCIKKEIVPMCDMPEGQVCWYCKPPRPRYKRGKSMSSEAVTKMMDRAKKAIRESG